MRDCGGGSAADAAAAAEDNEGDGVDGREDTAADSHNSTHDEIIRLADLYLSCNTPRRYATAVYLSRHV
jgi:hypothetical protein